MANNFAKGIFKPKHPEKYIGNGTPTYRSSWELSVMMMLDNHPSIDKWASESISIPYINPITQKPTTYIPDFFVSYIDKNSKRHAELWEIKPAKHSDLAYVGKSKINQAQYVINMAKWEVARAYCKQNGILFRVLTENDIFALTEHKKKRK